MIHPYAKQKILLIHNKLPKQNNNINRNYTDIIAVNESDFPEELRGTFKNIKNKFESVNYDINKLSQEDYNTLKENINILVNVIKK